MRRALAALITAAIGAAMLWTGLRRENGPAPESPIATHRDSQTASTGRTDAGSHPGRLAGAAERIEGLLEYARRGDVPGYLNSFAGRMHARLQQQVGERGLQAFAAELRHSGQRQTNHAVFAAEAAGEAPVSARVTVETTFADRIERQTYYLELGDAGWLVADVERAREHVPRNRLGSWATYQEPEGVPVTSASRTDVDNQENPYRGKAISK